MSIAFTLIVVAVVLILAVMLLPDSSPKDNSGEIRGIQEKWQGRIDQISDDYLEEVERKARR
jgi:hypothetical protein